MSRARTPHRLLVTAVTAAAAVTVASTAAPAAGADSTVPGTTVQQSIEISTTVVGAPARGGDDDHTPDDPAVRALFADLQPNVTPAGMPASMGALPAEFPALVATAGWAARFPAKPEARPTKNSSVYRLIADDGDRMGLAVADLQRGATVSATGLCEMVSTAARKAGSAEVSVAPIDEGGAAGCSFAVKVASTMVRGRMSITDRQLVFAYASDYHGDHPAQAAHFVASLQPVLDEAALARHLDVLPTVYTQGATSGEVPPGAEASSATVNVGGISVEFPAAPTVLAGGFAEGVLAAHVTSGGDMYWVHGLLAPLPVGAEQDTLRDVLTKSAAKAEVTLVSPPAGDSLDGWVGLAAGGTTSDSVVMTRAFAGNGRIVLVSVRDRGRDNQTEMRAFLASIAADPSSVPADDLTVTAPVTTPGSTPARGIEITDGTWTAVWPVKPERADKKTGQLGTAQWRTEDETTHQILFITEVDLESPTEPGTYLPVTDRDLDDFVTGVLSVMTPTNTVTEETTFSGRPAKLVTADVVIKDRPGRLKGYVLDTGKHVVFVSGFAVDEQGMAGVEAFLDSVKISD